MIDRFHLSSAELDRFRSGPLGPHLNCLAELLSEQGYSRQMGMQKMRLIALLSRWLEQQHIRAGQLNEKHIAHFLAAQKKALRQQRQVQHTLAQLLQALRRLRIIPGPQPAEAQSSTDRLLRDYGRFLIQERGLGQATLDNYIPVARRLLIHAFGVKSVHLDQLAVGDVNRFILREKSTFSPKRVQLTTSALRSFLGFL